MGTYRFYALLIGLLVATSLPPLRAPRSGSGFYALLIGLLVATIPTGEGRVRHVSMPS